MKEGIRQYSVEKGTEEIIYKANRLNMEGKMRLMLLLAAKAKEMHPLLGSKFGTICSILFSKGTCKFYYPAIWCLRWQMNVTDCRMICFRR